MFYHYTGNAQFDLQINRICSRFEGNEQVAADLHTIVPQLKDIASWSRVWKEFAIMRESLGDDDIAASYFFGASFYLLENDPDRDFIQQHRLACFYRAFADLELERHQVPYEKTSLPAVRISSAGATKNLLIFGGYDSNMEELIAWMSVFADGDYNLILFEGPGQGNLLFQREKSYFIPNFEEPVAAVLDYFGLDQVTVLGLSWGGYFAMRAAAFEKRIKRVIAFDIFYQGMDALTMELNWFTNMIFKVLFVGKQKWLLNTALRFAMKRDLDLYWKIERGYQLTGTKTPYDFLKKVEQHSIKGLEPLIDQDVLLLAGEEDQYVPAKRLIYIKERLINARKIEAHLFTKETGGEQHCQVGSTVAIEAIRKFLA
ncbi:alpha/beta fold hydrolase [Streptococcus dentiloxodontae]